MPRRSNKSSGLTSEAEEADWHASAEGRRQTAREFGRAPRAGTIARSAGAKVAKTDPALLQQLMEQAKENTTRAISIRIPVAIWSARGGLRMRQEPAISPYSSGPFAKV